MRETRIIAEPFEFVTITEFQCKRALNEHGFIEMKGVISRENAEKYQAEAVKETWVTVKLVNESEEDKIFFCGIVTKLLIEKENLVNTLSFTAKTGSYMLDLVQHNRSFQKSSYTYEEVLENTLSSGNGKFMMLEKQGDKINRFLMQYKETDWEFICRLAGCANTVIIPEFLIPGKNLYFGYKKNAKKEEIIADNYRITQEHEVFQRRKNKNDNMGSGDQFVYEIESREVYSLGDTIIFQGKDLVVGKITSQLEGQELKHTYMLHTKAMGFQLEEGNHKITGVSLKANVINVNKTEVTIQIQDDENKSSCGSRWFDFATVYSTSDGTGWYCMPEIGDEVRINFPDSEEDNAYVVSCIHLDNGSRENPDEKSWKNKQRKEILFTPTSLILRNNRGMSIEIDDAEGIKVVSDKKIIVQADQDISISSGAGVQMSASDSMLLSQGGASIQMNDTINISGGKIYMN